MSEENGILGLTTIRRNRGVSLEQIAAATKISLRALQAIEGGEFQKLPGGIYNTSYIRQYAKAIDFDARALLEYYYSKTGTPEAPNGEEPAANGKPKGPLRGFRPSAILGL
jgi:cytoskeletal protein RodZ